MALEAFVTALACLSTTTMPDKPVPHIMVNSQEPFRLGNVSSSPKRSAAAFQTINLSHSFRTIVQQHCCRVLLRGKYES